MNTDDMSKPGWEEFPAYNAEIISPQLPCGAGWLGNCLLELGVSLWQPWDKPTNPMWQHLGNFQYRYKDRSDRISTWRQTLPALKAGRVFTFSPNLVPKISHRRKRALPGEHRTILFVRDPRDALYSEWKRQCINAEGFNLSFEQFAKGPFLNQPYSYLQYLKQFLQDWREELANTSHLILRFEDYRTAPEGTLSSALDYFSLHRSTNQIADALRASDFHIGKAIETKRRESGKLRTQLYRAGVPLEYKHSFSPDMLALFSPDFDSLFEWLGYEVV